MSASRLQRRACAPLQVSRGRSSLPKRTNSSPIFTCLSLDDSVVVASPSGSTSPPDSPGEEVEREIDLAAKAPEGSEGAGREDCDEACEGSCQDPLRSSADGRERVGEDGEEGEEGERRDSLGLDISPSITSVLSQRPPRPLLRIGLGSGTPDRDRVARTGTISVSRCVLSRALTFRHRHHALKCAVHRRARVRPSPPRARCPATSDLTKL